MWAKVLILVGFDDIRCDIGDFDEWIGKMLDFTGFLVVLDSGFYFFEPIYFIVGV